MARMTKTQVKRLYRSIKQKARKAWGEGSSMNDPSFVGTMSTNDMIAIEKICDKYLKKL